MLAIIYNDKKFPLIKSKKYIRIEPHCGYF
jgi:hypothetical protein